MEISKIKEALNLRMSEVCQFLYPNGKLEGGNWKVGSPSGEAGGSMAIQVNGSRAGLWADFAGKEGGDVLELWKVARGVDFFTAKLEAEKFLGGSKSEVLDGLVRKSYTAPAKITAEEVKSNEEAEKYLKVARCLSEETISRFRVKFKTETRDFVFPYLDREGKLKNRKYIGLDRPEGKKKCRIEKNGFPILFGWHASAFERVAIITEGEVDAMTWTQVGFPALSVPQGIDNLDWIELEWENLEAFEWIYVSMDMDDAGQKKVEEIVRRLGIGRCRIIKLPFKDANECLQHGWTAEDFRNAGDEAKQFEIKKIISVEEAGKISDENEKNPPQFFYFNILGGAVAFGKSELTLWAGYTNHGKTTILNNMIVEAAMNDLPVFLASLEQDPDELLRCCESILTMKQSPGTEEKKKAREKLADRIYFLNHVGRATPKDILFYIEYVVSKYGVKHVIVDSLALIDLAQDDFNGQKKFAEDLRTAARRFKCEVHLVIHTTKEHDEHDMKKQPTLAILRGSADMGHCCDNAFFVRRNPEKYNDPDGNPEKADTLLLCIKNRRGGYRGTVNLYFDRKSGQFSRTYPFTPAKYINWVK